MYKLYLLRAMILIFTPRVYHQSILSQLAGSKEMDFHEFPLYSAQLTLLGETMLNLHANKSYVPVFKACCESQCGSITRLKPSTWIKMEYGSVHPASLKNTLKSWVWPDVDPCGERFLGFDSSPTVKT